MEKETGGSTLRPRPLVIRSRCWDFGGMIWLKMPVPAYVPDKCPLCGSDCERLDIADLSVWRFRRCAKCLPKFRGQYQLSYCFHDRIIADPEKYKDLLPRLSHAARQAEELGEELETITEVNAPGIALQYRDPES